jgi:DNA-binding PucR family transcriptional regulator
VDSSEAILGYRLRQHHAGLVCWTGEADIGGGDLARLERATTELARTVGCAGRPIFLPQDESYAWAWLPLGAEKTLTLPGADSTPAEAEAGVRFAVGGVGSGLSGFRRTHQQALAAYAVALAASPPGRFLTSFSDVAPLALMSGSIDLVRAWVIEILGGLASDDAHNATLRDTLRVFLQENGSFKATAERLVLHKNTVQYRIRKAEESLGHPVGQNRLHVELALLASQWLGPAALRQAGAPATGRRGDTRRVERSAPG